MPVCTKGAALEVSIISMVCGLTACRLESLQFRKKHIPLYENEKEVSLYEQQID